MALSADTLMTPDALHELLIQNANTVKILDGSFSMPGKRPTAREAFHNTHIPGAQFFDIDDAADKTSDLPHMMPSAETFADYVGSLGISADDHVIIYGQENVAMGPCRVLWMFHHFGHQNISLLNASLHHWRISNFPVNKGPAKSPENIKYHVNAERDVFTNLPEMRQAVENLTHVIVDARPEERFSGTLPEPREGLRSGHMPGALNIPAGQLLDPETGGLLAPSAINEIFNVHGDLSTRKPVITSCGSGVTACVLSLGLNMAGREDVKVYDGSWSEWGQEELNTPVEPN